jgi:hypothetical protein
MRRTMRSPGECPWCGPAVFEELTDEEIEDAPAPDECADYWACGCYPVGEVVRPIDRLPTYEEYARA